MKKRFLIIVVSIIVLTICTFSLAGCAKLQDDDAFDILHEAYENSVGIKEGSEWGNIYYYQETVREKARLDNGSAIEGYQNDLSVNIHCYYDEKNGYNFDKDYSVSINQKFKKESIDDTEKTTMVDIGANDITATPNKSKVDSLFAVNTSYDQKGQQEQKKFVQNNVNAKDFVKSRWFEEYTLQSKLSIFGNLTQNDITFVDTKDAKAGKEKVFMTTKLSFKLTEQYLKEHPEASFLDGDYVYIEIVNVGLFGKTDYRINNVYVFKTEKIGGMDLLKLSYESYILNISYMGPNINQIEQKSYEQKTDLFANDMINTNYLFKP